jgi:hypothetical protein
MGMVVVPLLVALVLILRAIVMRSPSFHPRGRRRREMGFWIAMIAIGGWLFFNPIAYFEVKRLCASDGRTQVFRSIGTKAVLREGRVLYGVPTVLDQVDWRLLAEGKVSELEIAVNAVDHSNSELRLFRLTIGDPSQGRCLPAGPPYPGRVESNVCVEVTEVMEPAGANVYEAHLPDGDVFAEVSGTLATIYRKREQIRSVADRSVVAQATRYYYFSLPNRMLSEGLGNITYSCPEQAQTVLDLWTEVAR